MTTGTSESDACAPLKTTKCTVTKELLGQSEPPSVDVPWAKS